MMTSTIEAPPAPETSGMAVLCFERYQLHLRRRVLLDNGRPVALGSRALTILTMLAQHAGEMVPKRELQRRLWQNVMVEDGTLRVHIAALQKVLGESQAGGRCIENIPGQGYRLVVPVTSLTEAEALERSPTLVWRPPRATAIPNLNRIIGRTRTLSLVAASLGERQLVTLTGAGGAGKTTVALGVAETSAAQYPDGIFFVDLAAVTEDRLVAGTLAAGLGIATLAPDPVPCICTFLRARQALVVLDSCEHVVEAIAPLVRSVLSEAPAVRILATSREPLAITGEWVHRVAPLEFPARRAVEGCESLLAYSAVQLFVERAQASSEVKFDLQALQVVAELCRRLGGNPLAIEITAARVALLGLKGLLASLEQGLHLSIGGSRVAVARHRSLRKTLDWSYELLPPVEQAIFRRLAVFRGPFDLNRAVAVVSNGTDATEVFEALLQLSSKSLIVADSSGQKILYRLLDTARAYAAEQLRAAGELHATHDRHTRMWCTLGTADVYSQLQHGAAWAVIFNENLDDLRATLQWNFSAQAEAPIGSKLRLLSLWYEFVLAAEYSGWTQWRPVVLSVLEPEYAKPLISVLDRTADCALSPIEVLTVTSQTDAQHPGTQREASWSLWIEHLVRRDFRVALELADAFRDLPPPRTPSTMLDELLAVIYYYAGELEPACRHAERALTQLGPAADRDPATPSRECQLHLILMRALWLRGLPELALAVARCGLAAGKASGNAHLRGLSLLGAISLTHLAGRQSECHAMLATLREHADSQRLEHFQLWVSCMEEILKHTDAAEEPLITMLSPEPWESSRAVDSFATVAPIMMIRDTSLGVEHARGGNLTAEILRVKAELLWRAQGDAAFEQTQSILQRALQIARAQQALIWELRVAMSLARLLSTRGQRSEAHELLAAVYALFREGHQTPDLLSAARLLQSLATC
jgi:predicted ATPase/DNA-binding winged helix-turn-helix (wHTH) protein